jgi:hypothetical protein
MNDEHAERPPRSSFIVHRSSLNYDAFLERDVVGIRAAIAEFRREHSSHDLFLAVARFAVLAYAPSQHAKHALIACLSAYDVREHLGDRWDELLTECAIYAAQSRQPWSEPPILDPPRLDDDQRGDIEELRAAVADGDRLRAERWLAKRIDDHDLANDYFIVAADDFEDLGHKLIVANAAWRLAEILGEKGRFATLRVGVWEMTAYKGERYEERGAAVDPDVLIERATDIESLHRVFLYFAAREPVRTRVYDYLATVTPSGSEGPGRPGGAIPLPIYSLANDYAAYLKSWAIGDENLKQAARHNLDHGPNFADWSFA